MNNTTRVPYSVNCSLCGCNGASVRCEKCNSMAFCIGCDDMYHRHPKRRNHLRQAVALEYVKHTILIFCTRILFLIISFCSYQMQAVEKYKSSQTDLNQTKVITTSSNPDNNSLYPWRRVRTLPRMPDNWADKMNPSKMPIPPPRRKRKPLSFSGIKVFRVVFVCLLSNRKPCLVPPLGYIQKACQFGQKSKVANSTRNTKAGTDLCHNSASEKKFTGCICFQASATTTRCYLPEHTKTFVASIGSVWSKIKVLR